MGTNHVVRWVALVLIVMGCQGCGLTKQQREEVADIADDAAGDQAPDTSQLESDIEDLKSDLEQEQSERESLEAQQAADKAELEAQIADLEARMVR